MQRIIPFCTDEIFQMQKFPLQFKLNQRYFFESHMKLTVTDTLVKDQNIELSTTI